MRQKNKILLDQFSIPENTRVSANSDEKVPFWLMRQAGRYLPEYRALRAEKGSFLNLVYDPHAASEVTMQPIRRFGMDGAILFSDILVTSQAMGQDLRFETGEGPKLDPVRDQQAIDRLSLDDLDQTLSPIYETLRLTRQKLNDEGFEGTTLIGFAGAPWTVACYMINGQGSKDYAFVKQFMRENPALFDQIIDKIIAATIYYLGCQIDAGAEVIQIFDSWSGLLDEDDFNRYVILPTQKIIQSLRADYPSTPIIGFPRGAGKKVKAYVEQTKVNGLSLDETADLQWVCDHIHPDIVLQGNLSNQILLQGGDTMIQSMTNILETMRNRRFIFNLGHGVIKETPVEHVEQLSEMIKGYRQS